MTEDEAKTRECPIYGLGRVIMSATACELSLGGAPHSEAKLMVKSESGKCIGSACMLWRGGRVWQVDPYPSGEVTGSYVMKNRYLVNDDSGYCGLAGKP